MEEDNYHESYISIYRASNERAVCQYPVYKIKSLGCGYHYWEPQILMYQISFESMLCNFVNLREMISQQLWFRQEDPWLLLSNQRLRAGQPNDAGGLTMDRMTKKHVELLWTHYLFKGRIEDSSPGLEVEDHATVFTICCHFKNILKRLWSAEIDGGKPNGIQL